jgi:branched-chain amino acid aminotransferase
MAERMVYWNGDFVPEIEARVSIFDSTMMTGDMVFEMTRTFNGTPFRLQEHLARLAASLRYARIDCGMSVGELEAATLATIERNRAALGNLDFQIMHDISRGGLPLYDAVVREGTAPLIIITTFPLVRHLAGVADAFQNGKHGVLTPQQSVPARYLDPKTKNRSRLFYKLAEMQAADRAPGAVPLLTDERGFLTESVGANLFIAHAGNVSTPKPHDILRGVSRDACIELAQELGIEVLQTDISPYELREADEAWLTSTPFCMLPLTQFEDRAIGSGAPGPLYRRLLERWAATVGVDIAKQATEYQQLAPTWQP